MDSSVDSIGACSIDMEASVTMPDWSEASSDGTLRSVSIIASPVAAADKQQQHLPSYLSLACTVNGYSTTTNYDSVRFARSRDASPNRPQSEHLTGGAPRVYSVANNLLSPPNLVPLPTHNGNGAVMTENILRQHRHHEEFYRSTKSMTYISKESHFTSSMFPSKDNVDGCIENDAQTIQSKFVKFESSNLAPITKNSQSKTTFETTVKKEYSNGKETKSFIQQRVERLYGPGALAQGFFVSKRQKNRLSVSEEQESAPPQAENDKHSKSLTDKLLPDDDDDCVKVSNTNSALPVLRHLRPEFRAQLPIISPRKSTEAASPMQKSVTVPKLKDEVIVKVNGHSKEPHDEDVEAVKAVQNGTAIAALAIDEDSGTKDGHYFLKIVEVQSKRLLELADKTEKELANAHLMSDEVVGKIRSAAGKGRLLVSQKIQQFKGLCVNNLTQSPGEAFPTTNEDLQGFWDMVMLQVDQVDRLFEEIDKLKKNDWEEVTVKREPAKQNGTAKLRKVVSKPKLSAANEEARKQREEQRKKMIEERRKAMKAQQPQLNNGNSSIEIFVPESS